MIGLLVSLSYSQLVVLRLLPSHFAMRCPQISALSLIGLGEGGKNRPLWFCLESFYLWHFLVRKSVREKLYGFMSSIGGGRSPTLSGEEGGVGINQAAQTAEEIYSSSSVCLGKESKAGDPRDKLPFSSIKKKKGYKVHKKNAKGLCFGGSA